MEESNSKKYIKYAIIGILFIMLVFGILYFLFFRNSPGKTNKPSNSVIGRIFGFPAPQPVPPEPPPTILPVATSTPEASSTTPVAEQKLIQLTDFPVSSAALNKTETGVLFYKKDGGNLFFYDFSGKTKNKLSNITIVGIFDVAWNVSQNKRIISYIDQDIVKSFVHIGTTSVALLPSNLRSLVWSPDGNSLAYLSWDGNHNNLIISDASGKSSKKIFSTPLRDISIQWVTNDRIVFDSSPTGLDQGFSFIFSRSKSSFDKVLSRFGLMALWSPYGTRVLASETTKQGKKLSLSIFDTAGNKLFATNLPTIAEKCIWVAKDKAYCAVPRNIQTDTIWPDDYLRGEIQTADKIVSIDLNTKDIEEIFNADSFDISNLLVTKKEDYLLFINRGDGTLWSLKLK